MDRNELKVQALLEKVSKLTAEYENQVADLRVDITILNSLYEQAQNELKELKEANEVQEPEEIVVDDASENDE